MTDADICRKNGWTVGTRLVGDIGYGPDVIEITAIGRGLVLAVSEPLRCESLWSLTCREWKAVV